MHEFPSELDVLVRPPSPGEDPTLNACFMESTWDLYAHGYQDAAIRLYEWIGQPSANQDTLVYPFVFNWRQVVEIRLKQLIVLGPVSH